MNQYKIGIIGNGSVGTRLAALMREAGHDVVVGQRTASEAEPGYEDAARHGQIVVLAIPFVATADVLAPLRSTLGGKIVIDATNPLAADWSPMRLGEDNSGGEETQRRLPDAHVVKAFNTIFADAMYTRPDTSRAAQTAGFLCGDNAEARATVADMIASIGFAPIDTGPLRCARYLEAMAHLNIQIAVGMKGGTGAVFGYHTPARPEANP